MKIGQILSAIAGHHTTAVILASGSGSRFGGDTPKQLVPILGRTVLERSLDAFEECGYIDDIILVVSAECLEKAKDIVAYNGFKKVISIIEGGKTRQESAFIGMEALPKKTSHIAVHDAARCLVTPEMISMVAASAYRTGCSFASFKPKDTVKLITKNQITVNKDGQLKRDLLVCASTPQIFKVDVYRAGAYLAKQNGFVATDDCSLVEHIGFSCHPVDCGEENLKITTPIDVACAEFILKERAEKKALIEEEKNSKKGGKK